MAVLELPRAIGHLRSPGSFPICYLENTLARKTSGGLNVSIASLQFTIFKMLKISRSTVWISTACAASAASTE